jgi:class 3 adenylate cyclase/HAMP domain-containing protein
VKIRSKIILVVLPLVIVPLVLAEAASYVAATKGINRVTERFLGFKSAELQKYAESQWKLLVDNNYAGREDMIEAAENAVQIYAKSILTSETEAVLAFDETGGIRMEAAAPNSAANAAVSAGRVMVSNGEIENLLKLLEEENSGVQTASIGGVERVFRSFYFPPFGWYVLTTEERAVFYRDADGIKFQTIVVIVGASALAVALLIIFSLMLARPLSKVAAAMNGIIGKGDMTGRVEVEYRDETGELAHTFNVMIAGLEDAYKQIKKHAFEAVLAQKKEQRIRQIFQKYVPTEIIDKFFASPESMLVGDNRDLAILFSDIRGFTTISEGMKPDDLVASLNRYFSGQVDIIMNRNGVVDKYIGDAIMAFWGAPLKHADDAMQSVLSGLDMIDSLKTFNAKQQSLGKPEFRIGIGIGYGSVTVGNIGSERKMDYTVIGDMVNLASRMEGLTKVYRAEILISESLFDQIRPDLENRSQTLSVRLLDKVAVKGKTQGVKIFTVKRDAPAAEKEAWLAHNRGMKLYFQRSFAEAAALFRDVAVALPGDFNVQTMLERCEVYAKAPPPPDWDGVEVMHSK